MADLNLNVYEIPVPETSVTWGLEDNNCSSLTGWTDGDVGSGVSEISPAGQWHFISSVGSSGERAVRYKDLGDFSATAFTIEVKIYVNQVGTVANGDHIFFTLYRADEHFAMRWCSDGLYIRGASADVEVCDTTVMIVGAWQTWRFVVNVSADTCDIYLKNENNYWETIATGVDSGQAGSYSANAGEFWINVRSYNTAGTECHIDHLKVVNSAQPPIYALIENTSLILEEVPIIISIYDEISTTENISLDVLAISDLDISIYDTLSITENIGFSFISLDIDINIYDSISITENIENYLDVLNLSTYDELSITENLSIDVSVVPALSISTSDNLSIIENAEAKLSAGGLPFLTQNSAWYDGTYYWRSWYDRTNQYIKFEYTLDPANSWTENINARISDAGVLNDYSLMGGHNYGCIVYQINGEIKARLANNYPSTSFAFDVAVTILTDVSKTYKRPVVEYVASSRYWVSATEFNGSKQYAIAIRATAKNSISSWDTMDVLGDTNNEESSFTCVSRIGTGKTDNVVCVYSEGTSLKLKHYNGGSWGANVSVATIKVGTVVLTESQNFDVDTDLYDYNVHFTYIKSDGTACANHYDGSLNSEVVLDANTDCGHAKLGAFGDTYAIHAWERPSAGEFCDSYYCMEHLPTGVCSGIIFLRESTGICYRSTLSVSSASMDASFLTWEQSDGLIFSVPLTVGDRIHENVSVAENIVLNLDVLSTNIYDEVSLIENTQQYLDILSTSIYDDIVTVESIIMHDIAIDLSVYEDLSIIENFSISLDQLYISSQSNVMTIENITAYTTSIGGLDMTASTSVVINENISIQADLNINTYDSIIITENYVLMMLSNISILELLGITESFEKIVVSDELFPRLFTVVPRMRTFERDKTDYNKIYVEV